MAVKDSDIKTWHKRLSHIGEKALETLAIKGFLPSVAGTSLKTYVYCLIGKTHRIAFKSFSQSKKSYILNLIHIDVCMMWSRSIGNALYFVTFIDDYSRKVWALALKFKDQVLNIFKFFYAYIEIGIRRKLKCVRADNDGEYRRPFK